MRKSVKRNKYERLPDAMIDLHGLYVAEAQTEFQLFLHDSLQNNYRSIKVITGKGLHSADGVSKIKEMVIDILSAHGLKHRPAKLNDGGEGALIVDL